MPSNWIILFWILNLPVGASGQRHQAYSHPSMTTKRRQHSHSQDAGPNAEHSNSEYDPKTAKHHEFHRNYRTTKTTTNSHHHSNQHDSTFGEKFYTHDVPPDSQYDSKLYPPLDWKDLWRSKETAQALQVLFPNPKPRDLIHAIFKASKSTTLGFLLGMTSVFTFPALTLSLGGSSLSWKPLLGSLLMGVVAGGASIVYGIWSGLYYCAWGMWQTPRAVESSWTDLVWNPKDGTWEMYRLDDHSEQLLNQWRSARHHDSNKNYYQILEVPVSATKAEIKRAYHQKALQLHPDKRQPITSPDETTSVDDFHTLQQAYQTLANDKRRALYDEWGESTSDLSWDPYVLVSTYFQATPLEPYTGELAIASWTEQLLQYWMYASNNQNDWFEGKGDQHKPSDVKDFLPNVERMIQIIASFDLKVEKRQVDVAMHIRRFIHPYIVGTIKEQGFRAVCREEAHRMLESGASPTLLVTLGKALERSAQEFRGFHRLAPFGWPWGVITWTRNLWRSTSNRFISLSKVLHLLQLFNSLPVHQRRKPMHKDLNSDTEDELAKIKSELLAMLPELTTLGQSLNVWDISKTIQGVSWKLFHDSSVSKSERMFRSKATRIMGEEFAMVGLKEEEEKVKNENSDFSENVQSPPRSTNEYTDGHMWECFKSFQEAVKAAKTKRKGDSS